MRTGFEVTAFPTRLLEKYSTLGLSDKDLLNIIAFFSFDMDLDKAARIRGYSTAARMRAAMQGIFDKGLIVENKGNLDFSPLLAAVEGQQSQGIFVLQEGKKPIDRDYYAAYAEIEKKVSGNKYAWAKFFEEMVKANNYSFEDVLGCIEFIASYYETTSKGVVRTVYIDAVRANIDKWIDKGKPKQYQNVDVDAVMSMINGS